ncbi:MAG: DUF4412 domain-containing protein [Gemmatimonadota bacterium]|nr:MAG: DUF4412 domain-containing protein [Gemmatimonadota bacterium]
MRLSRFFAVAALLATLALPGLTWAQGFEGTIETRAASLSEAALKYLLGPAGEGDEFDASGIFDVPIAQIIETAPELGEIEVDALIYHFKGTVMRVDGGLEGEMPGYAILDFGAGWFSLVNPAEQMVLEMTSEDFEQLKAMTAEEEPTEPRAKPQVRPLGRSKEVIGMHAEAFEVKSEDETTIAWVTKDLSDVVEVFLELESRMKSMGMFEEGDKDTEVFLLLADHGFPIVEQTLTRYPWGEYAYEISAVISVERTSLPDDMFAIPEDYERHSILEMMRIFGGEN